MSIGFLSHVIETKGLFHSIERTLQVLLRYSFGRQRFTEMMEALEKGLGPIGVRVTFCVTGDLLESHHSFFERFRDLGHEFAAHGYVHTNMKLKRLEEQCDLVEKSYAAFEKARLPVNGFRCPYLSYNGDTMAALGKSRFLWTSNNLILWDEGVNPKASYNRHMKKLGLLYNTSSHEVAISLPSQAGKLIDIPITAPDDEMLFERYRVKESSAITGVWSSIFEKIYSRGELFHLLFHPERFRYFERTIKVLAEQAREKSPKVWFATLGEITAWWERRQSSAWEIENTNGRAWLRLTAPPESAVLMKRTERQHDDRSICGIYSVADMSMRDGYSCFETDDWKKHTIQLSNSCSPDVRRFLSEEGFIVTVEEEPHKEALLIDGYQRFGDNDRRPLLEMVEKAPYPLLRLWRWPYGAQCAFAISSDVDSINVADFFKRMLNF
ncbi:MAG TPA: hypothetical protein DDW94_03560 [Deltaproteobacteria bacterium]|nr:MAG: hypothetical protein A2Z79_10255 [Deltaproteobacteria bacterium GWA2_55_82]OGQ62984.1 MAG: hypothetical protein A3I81_06715 [Deltaproteobacteria bacterium RIFCSPLOWO2_02_FULL_55_12]OIJ72948.1 MAG: hypothetical protein A2V21_300950 [Deltaproteobacteria bacterium GWC2_55_46]HBG46046.1 hypothetical protein [Deltaproteobacteria bacterium]HCY11736.1 hypothetical protein [Deltaproteobacteria bacterium]